jgi:hypothetical protein
MNPQAKPKTSVRVRSNSGSFNFTGFSGNHFNHQEALEKMPDHPLRTHLLDLQSEWDKDQHKQSFIHPPLGCAEVASMLAVQRQKGWGGVEKATFGEAHEGQYVVKTRCDHCSTWQQQNGQGNWGVKPELHVQKPNSNKAPVFSDDDFPPL